MVALNEDKNNAIILKQIKQENDIIYGARSIQRQIGILSRPTKDWDVFSNKPKSSAMIAERNLEKQDKGEQYYVKPALHPGTYKVEYVGADKRKGTKDDVGVIDFTQTPSPKPKTINIGGILYRKISEEKKAKLKALKDKTQEFRHQKDQEDYNRIELASMDFNPTGTISKFKRAVKF